MTFRGLDRLLRPQYIAVIGGGTWCENVIRACHANDFQGTLEAVHPQRTEIAGCRAVPSLSNLPRPPDAAFVGINRHKTVKIVQELRSMGAGGAICFASGFQEAAEELSDGTGLQADLIAAAGAMPILGPNCYGYINALDGAALWPDQHGLARVKKGVAIVAQSSNIALNLTMQTRGLPVAYLVTAGNQAQIGISEIGSALLDDDRVTAIGLHIEGIDDLTAFEAFARKAHALGKPVVALKVGRSEQARAATVSHTASLAGSSAGASALFERLGIAEVRDLPVLLEALKVVHVAGALASPDLASLSCSGGEAGLIADLAIDTTLSFPALSNRQKAGLREALGPKVALANPLDYHTYIWGDANAMSRAFSAMMDGPPALGIVILDIPRLDRCDPAAWLKTVEAVKRAKAASGKPFAVLTSLSEGMPEALAAELIGNGIVPLSGLRDAMGALEAAYAAAAAPNPHPIHRPHVPDSLKTLNEEAAKRALSAFHLRVPQNRRADCPASAALAAQELLFPVVLKGLGIAHKSEAGAVALNLQDKNAVMTAACAMPAGSFLIEEMVTDVLAELLVGVINDPAHGLVLTLAAGGVLTEILNDRASLLLPVERTDVEAALETLSYARVLDGYRGASACDLEAIIDAVMAVQAYALSEPVAEIEINPLLCGADFAIAADALITCGEFHEP
ncbi:acyl-CoA synthetase (NDP forming) [Roseibium hamelinense]|uniref:Acyl-CoA synthetase (NDP forming) n=1 Tax=Roseibium hamelinense TaxID=150831 RepID=A0A562SXI3_9HYPH|nr:acetate--CoA ligase family protein [Roseibium hamelinense]MTI44766.1 CoA-binding protein [Roseibium hamelinense]TWI86045.1 acyl-CoA synthetase (NDP forming) [Roseibium hamelinense]